MHKESYFPAASTECSSPPVLPRWPYENGIIRPTLSFYKPGWGTSFSSFLCNGPGLPGDAPKWSEGHDVLTTFLCYHTNNIRYVGVWSHLDILIPFILFMNIWCSYIVRQEHYLKYNSTLRYEHPDIRILWDMSYNLVLFEMRVKFLYISRGSGCCR